MNANIMNSTAEAGDYAALQDQGGKTACIAIVWVREGVSGYSKQLALLEHIGAQAGVISARLSAASPTMLMVDYTPGQTQAASIVRAISATGLRARLVGC